MGKGVGLALSAVVLLSLFFISACVSKSSYDKVQAELSQTQAELSQTQGEKARLEGEVANLSSSLSGERTKVNSLTTQLDAAKTQATNLEGQLKEKEGKISSLTSEATQLKSQLDTSTKALADLKPQLDSSSKMVASLESKLADQEAKVMKLTFQNSSLEADLSKEKDRAAALSTSLAQAEAARAKLEEEMKSLKAQLVPGQPAYPTPSAEPPAAVAFVTYVDQEYGFSIAYPQGWERRPEQESRPLEMERAGIIFSVRDPASPVRQLSVFVKISDNKMTPQDMAAERLRRSLIYSVGNLWEVASCQELEGYYRLKEGGELVNVRVLSYVGLHGSNWTGYDLTVALPEDEYKRFKPILNQIFDSFKFTRSR